MLEKLDLMVIDHPWELMDACNFEMLISFLCRLFNKLFICYCATEIVICYYLIIEVKRGCKLIKII